MTQNTSKNHHSAPSNFNKQTLPRAERFGRKQPSRKMALRHPPPIYVLLALSLFNLALVIWEYKIECLCSATAILTCNNWSALLNPRTRRRSSPDENNFCIGFSNWNSILHMICRCPFCAPFFWGGKIFLPGSEY